MRVVNQKRNNAPRHAPRYAASVATGRWRAHANAALAETVQRLVAAERARRGGRLEFVHVKGHSGDAFNDRADALVQVSASSWRVASGLAPP